MASLLRVAVPWLLATHSSWLRRRALGAGTLRSQPFIAPAACGLALDAAPDAPTPDFSRWLNLALKSYAAFDLWTSSSPLLSKPAVLILGSGAARENDIASWCTRIASTDIHCVRIDQKIGGYEHDWMVSNVNDALIRLVSSEQVFAVFFAFPCASWSALRCLPAPPALLKPFSLPGGGPHGSSVFRSRLQIESRFSNGKKSRSLRTCKIEF